MPIERELKYVLRPTNSVVEQLERLACEKNWKRHLIQQAYIAPNARIRKKTPLTINGVLGKPEHTFTFKYDLPDFSVVEMESPISDFDFDCMWSSADTRLQKVRFSKAPKMDGNDGEGWDIDVFIQHLDEQLLDPYCILAECEMFGNRSIPLKLPGVVKRNLIHHVRPGDKGFSSKSIADYEKTTRIIRVLIELANENIA